MLPGMQCCHVQPERLLRLVPPCRGTALLFVGPYFLASRATAADIVRLAVCGLAFELGHYDVLSYAPVDQHISVDRD